MRPRGRGDDDFDDDDEFDDVSPPPQSVLDVEADAEAVAEEEAEAYPEPEPEPEPAPQPTRAPLSSLVVRPPPQDNGASSASPARSSSYPAGDAPGRRRGSSLPRRRRDISPPDPRGRGRRRSPPPPPARRRPGSPPLQRRRLSPPGFQPRPQRFYDEPQGYAIYASPSPPRQRRLESSNYNDTIGPRYNHGYQGSGRGGPRFRDGSPPYGRGGRSHGRGYNNAPAPAPGKDYIIIDGEYVHRNDPNLSPRAGDWICQNPSCGNLNFARRTHCNNCNKNRYESSRSPHRGYFDSPPRGPPRALGPPSDHAPPREMPKYRPPPRDWVGGDPRGYAARSPPVRAWRFPPDLLQRDRMGFRGDTELRDRAKYEWSAAEEYKQRERPRDGFYLDRSRRQSVSPRGNWGSDMRDRSRSPAGNRPMKGAFAGRGRPDLDYSGSYVGRGRSNTLDAGRGRVRGRGRGYRPGGDPYSGEGRGDYRPGGDPYPGEGRGDQRAAPRGRIEGRY